MKTIIVGAGAISYCHAEALTKLGIKIIGIYDINRESATKLATLYSTFVIDDFELAVKEADIVHICTPPSFRIQYAKIAMEAGCHVVMEKPMAITLKDAEILNALMKKNNRKLMIDFNHRFRYGFQRLLDIVKSGVIGDVINVYVNRMGMLGENAGTKKDTWRRNLTTVCGMSIESLSHDIDMIIQLAGPIASVKADIRGTYEDIPQFDNNVNVCFNLKNGAMGLINASWSSYLKSSSRGIIGTEGSVVLDGDDLFDFSRLRLRTKDMAHEEIYMLNDIYNFATCPSYYNANKYFIECILNDLNPSTSGEYALSTLKVSHAILESAKSQQTIQL
ncbi:Gfo/Idh/MocA family protein [Bacillus timonensis]|uniref:Gfo/Idh/MocA family protein n=1 Tax=Bacillus timonensis TaxID=1033734 RepID=UPI0013869BCB|nr:Gfo/Idh/MocA family oxidoreductase [Bacillus timonensis]